AFVTGLAGARAHGRRDLPPERKADVVTRRQVRSTDFVRVRRSQRPTATLLIDGVPTAGLARCVVDAAIRLSRLDDVRAFVAEAVMRRGLPVEDLVDELAGAPMRGSALLRRALGEVA